MIPLCVVLLVGEAEYYLLQIRSMRIVSSKNGVSVGIRWPS